MSFQIEEEYVILKKVIFEIFKFDTLVTIDAL